MIKNKISSGTKNHSTPAKKKKQKTLLPNLVIEWSSGFVHGIPDRIVFGSPAVLIVNGKPPFHYKKWRYKAICWICILSDVVWEVKDSVEAGIGIGRIRATVPGILTMQNKQYTRAGCR